MACASGPLAERATVPGTAATGSSKQRGASMQIPLVDLKAQYETVRDEVQLALVQALESMELTLGPNLRAFEAEFAIHCGVEHTVGVSSGTDALYLALRACGVGPGDEVITVANTFVATVEAIVLLGATPVFVDIDPDTYTLDPARLRGAIGPRSRAIVPVHLYGQMADMEAVMAIARRYGLTVVEDACQAHGAEFQGRRAGSIGDAAAFSFYVSKNLGAYGESGAVTTSSLAIAECVRRLRDHGSTRKYEHDEMGVNARMDELQAAVLRVKLRHLDEWNARRRALAARYDKLLASADIDLPITRPSAQHVFHLYVVRLAERERVRQLLADRGIATGVHYPTPIHHQPAALGLGRVAGDLRVTEAFADQILSLPMYAELSDEQLEHIADSLTAALRAASGKRRNVFSRGRRN
jgi:dTDP-4-amino-4,6-dideoxygalactose transaminase